MPHIHTGENEHDLTVTAYIIRTDKAEPEGLLHMHKKHKKLLPVGGHVELKETPWQGMAHEIAEESGYAFDQLQVLQPVSRLKKISNAVLHPYPLAFNTHDIDENHFHTDLSYGFITTAEPRLELAEGESRDLRWLTQAAMNALDHTQILANTKEIYNFLFDEAMEEWDRVETNEFSL